jgi:nitrogen fixation NifU-like protein
MGDPELDVEVILDHFANPRHHGSLEGPAYAVGGFSPGCTDQLVVYLALDASGAVSRMTFEGRGCTISQAAASMLTDLLPGRSPAEAARDGESWLAAALGRRTLETRHPCATLALRLVAEAAGASI